MEYQVYERILNFLFYLFTGDKPLEGPKITTERLVILRNLLVIYNEKEDLQETLKKAEHYVLEYLLSKRPSGEKTWGSLERYSMYLISTIKDFRIREQLNREQLNADAIELYFSHFLGVEYANCFGKNVFRIILKIFENYLAEGDYYYKKNLKSYPINVKVAKEFLKQIVLTKKKIRVSAFDWQIYELEWLIEDREKEIKDMIVNKEKSDKENKESENTKEG